MIKPLQVLAWAILAPTLLVPEPAVAAPKTHVVTMDKMKFGPVPAKVQVGDTIVWVNRDMFRHTATAADRSFDVDLPPKTKKSMVIRSAGTIPFTCTYHPGMRGVLRVTK